MCLQVFFKPSPTLRCMRTLCVLGQLSSLSVSPGHGLVLPEGESGGFEFAGRALMLSCVSPAIFVCTATPCMFVRMFGVPTRLLGSTLLQQCTVRCLWRFQTVSDTISHLVLHTSNLLN